MKSKAKEKTNREMRSDIQMSLQSWFPLHIPWIIFIMSLKMLALHQSHAQVLCVAWNFSRLLTSAWSLFLAQGLGGVQEITEMSSYSVSTQLVVNQGGAGGGGGLGRGGGRYLCKLKSLNCQWNQALWWHKTSHSFACSFQLPWWLEGFPHPMTSMVLICINYFDHTQNVAHFFLKLANFEAGKKLLCACPKPKLEKFQNNFISIRYSKVRGDWKAFWPFRHYLFEPKGMPPP